ncbi:MAG: M1 family peptidase, partial [Bacteroidetes bacterium]|nr:M1 family peptidase [Bacteroidota bacterium]
MPIEPMRRIIFILLIFTTVSSFAQPYRAAATKINDLVHTRLDLHFDYNKQYVYGKAWITLKPHFYPTDSLRLDAKGMDLQNVAVIEKSRLIPLNYSYDSLSIAIRLNKTYHSEEPYTIYIQYTAKPIKHGSHGPYFINPTGSEKGVPTEIWTTGEPDFNSCWFPTIDQPNQKCTDEISLTVPAKYVTLSNGRLAAQINHPDGTRTDTWKMELPHSPYLFMIAVGDFKIVHDSWHGKPLEYYMEPQYAADAKAIFGYTPEAMTFFSKILGVDFPWNKYAQIRVRSFNGGMENTSATEFNEDGQTSPRELADLPYQSGYVHELFHQWFGDYVTFESWANLALSESFADLGEILWAEYKLGLDV